jgi:hypothetical protein
VRSTKGPSSPPARPAEESGDIAGSAHPRALLPLLLLLPLPLSLLLPHEKISLLSGGRSSRSVPRKDACTSWDAEPSCWVGGRRPFCWSVLHRIALIPGLKKRSSVTQGWSCLRLQDVGYPPGNLLHDPPATQQRPPLHEAPLLPSPLLQQLPAVLLAPHQQQGTSTLDAAACVNLQGLLLEDCAAALTRSEPEAAPSRHSGFWEVCGAVVAEPDAPGSTVGVVSMKSLYQQFQPPPQLQQAYLLEPQENRVEPLRPTAGVVHPASGQTERWEDVGRSVEMMIPSEGLGTLDELDSLLMPRSPG